MDKDEVVELGGSSDYLAPELLQGEAPHAGSDLYAVGVLFYQMLTSALPDADTPIFPIGSLDKPDDARGGFAGSDSGFALDFDDLSGPRAVQPVLPGPLGPIVAKLCAYSPADRYADASVVLRDLAAATSIELPVETAATRESFLRATVLIGRDAELSVLAQALEQTKSATGQGFLIGGESGVGKSRLTAELRTLALVHGFWVAEGQSITEGGYYYQEWLPLLRALCFRSDVTDGEASILKDLIGDISALLGRPVANPPTVKPEAAQARLVNTVVSLLGRQSKPVTLILEDIQWARSESLVLLAQLAKAAAQLPILLVATYRTDESPTLPETLPDLRPMVLGRLDAPSIAALSGSMLGAVGQRPELVRYLARQTEGNVFFLVETVRALAENAGELQRIGQWELPDTILTSGMANLIARRIERVAAAFRPLLDFAATLGRQLDLSALAYAFPGTPLSPFLIECENAAVLESQGTDWRFAHNKLREHLLQHITERKALHAKVAYAIEGAYAGTSLGEMAATLAYHFQQAGILERALAYYMQAGDIATKLSLLEEARTYYGAAKATLEEMPDTTELRRLHVDILLKKVQAGISSDPSVTQLYRLAEARVLLEALFYDQDAILEDRLRMARVDYYCGRAYHSDGQPRAAVRHYRQVLPVAKEFADQKLFIATTFALGLELCLQGQFATALDTLSPLIEPIVSHFGMSLDSIRCLMYYGIALAASGRSEEAWVVTERANGWLGVLNQPMHRLTCAALHGLAAVMLADWPKAITLAERAIEVGKQSGEPTGQDLVLDLIAWSQSYLGQSAEALATRARSMQLRQVVARGVAVDWFEAAEAEILLNAGRPAAALHKAETVAASSQAAGLLFSQAIAERAWGCALSRLGAERAEMEAHFALSLEISRSAGQVMNAAQTELFWGRSLRERGDEEAAQVHFARALHELSSGGSPYALEAARRIVFQTD